jgi:uncharacterized lipoprotein YajG
MKRFLISAVLLALGSALFTSCSSQTTVPRETPASTTTSSTYSK